MGFSSKGGDGPVSDINVTPLVDVMLVLLIIFMVTSTVSRQIEEERLRQLPDTDLPVTTENPNITAILTEYDRLFLKIDDQLQVGLSGLGNLSDWTPITNCSTARATPTAEAFRPCFDEITQRLGQSRLLREHHQIYIIADRTIPFGFVVGTLHRLRAAGVDQVGMVTQPLYVDSEGNVGETRAN